jgi:hypothetical protein
VALLAAAFVDVRFLLLLRGAAAVAPLAAACVDVRFLVLLRGAAAVALLASLPRSWMCASWCCFVAQQPWRRWLPRAWMCASCCC